MMNMKYQMSAVLTFIPFYSFFNFLLLQISMKAQKKIALQIPFYPSRNEN